MLQRAGLAAFLASMLLALAPASTEAADTSAIRAAAPSDASTTAQIDAWDPVDLGDCLEFGAESVEDSNDHTAHAGSFVEAVHDVARSTRTRPWRLGERTLRSHWRATHSERGPPRA